jgi:hypothetical protein
MFEKLESVGEAFRNYFKKDKEEDERSSVKKLVEFQEAEKEYKPTEEQQKISQIEDTGETESIKQILERESAKKEEEGKEKDLDEKLADIEKVLGKFSEQTPLGSTSMPFDRTSIVELNKPIDFSKDIAKDYLGSVISQPTSQGDRIELLYANLRKQGLI